MRIITYPLFIILLVVLVAFALTNQQAITVGIWPFEYAFTLPAFVWFLGFLAIGLVGGAVFSSLGRQKEKAKLRILKKQTEQQSDEAKAIKAEVQTLMVQPQSSSQDKEQAKSLAIS